MLTSPGHLPASLSGLLVIDRLRISMPVFTVLVLPSYPLAMVRRTSSTVMSMAVRMVLPMMVARTMLATRVPMATVSMPVHLLLVCSLLRKLLLIPTLLPCVMVTHASILPAPIVGSAYFSLAIPSVVEAMCIDALFVTTAAFIIVFDKTPLLVALILLVACRMFVDIFVMHATGFVSLVLAFIESFFESFP